MDGEVAGTGYLSLLILSATLVDDNMGLSGGAGDCLLQISRSAPDKVSLTAVGNWNQFLVCSSLGWIFS